MAFVARFSFDVAFGKKAAMMKVLVKWEPVSREVGFPKAQILSGSIGAPESRIESNYVFETLAALEATWAKLGDPRVAQVQEQMAPLIVPGSHRWEIFRVQT